MEFQCGRENQEDSMDGQNQFVKREVGTQENTADTDHIGGSPPDGAQEGVLTQGPGGQMEGEAMPLLESTKAIQRGDQW